MSQRNPRCIIELKSTKYALKEIGQSDGDRQLFEYSFHAGAPLALLTNGVNWRFYSTQSAGTYEERLVSALDFKTDSLDEVAARLERYLSYGNTESGNAADYARKDLNARIDQHKAREAIPRAWAQLVEGDPDERLAALLTEATAALTEASPTRQDIAEFLRRLRPEGSRRRPPRIKPGGVGPTKPSRGPKAPRAPVHYWLLGEERYAGNAKEAYVAVFEALAEHDPEFLKRVAPKLRGRTLDKVARTRQELSSAHQSVVSLPGNWWLDVNLSNRQKVQYLRIACDAAGIQFGNRTGLDISLPNA